MVTADYRHSHHLMWAITLHDRYTLRSGNYKIADAWLGVGRSRRASGCRAGLPYRRTIMLVDNPRTAPGKARTPDVVGLIPKDNRNTAPEVRARYRYQDECAALAILRHLASDSLEGVLVEHSTDLILVPVEGMPELVSIKHREPNQQSTSTWSWNALHGQRVLSDLYRAWISTDRRCQLAFWSNSGYTGSSANRLWRTCALNEQPTPSLVLAVSKELGANQNDARNFIGALALPEDPLPRRKEITDVGIRRTADLLRKYRPTPDLYAESCYRELISRIAIAGTDLPDSEANPAQSVTATLTDVIADRANIQLMRKYLSRSHILEVLLRTYDQRAASSLPEIGQQGWEPDTHFTGRSLYLNKLDNLLDPTGVTETAPVVIYGIPGCGKTSLAAQFAAERKETLKAVFINASTRAALIRDLATLAGHDDPATWETGIAELRGPMTPTLPGTSATLLLLDGVTDPDTVRGIVPRRSLCRVIITSTVPHLDQGYEHIELQCWSRQESHTFIKNAFPGSNEDGRENLAETLGDHPLAITQAINYCRVMGRSLEDYLTRFKQRPVEILGRGEASGHLDSIIKTTRMSMAAAEERCRNSTHLLSLLAHLGSDPIDEPFLCGGAGLAFVSAPAPAPVTTDSRHQKSNNLSSVFRKSKQREPALAYTTEELSRRVHKMMRDSTWRDDAIETLLMTSLITRRGIGLVTHPLIARVVREFAGDPKPWLELGFGMFMDLLQPGFLKGFAATDPHLDHISALTSTALDGGFGGPATVIGCCALAHRIGLAAGNGSEMDRDKTAIEFGKAAVRLAREQVRAQSSSVMLLVQARRTLSQAFVIAGRLDDSMVQLRSNLAAAYRYQSIEILTRAIADISVVAADNPDRAVAETALNELNIAQASIPDKSAQVGISYAKSRLLRRLGRTNEATATLQEAMSIAEHTSNLNLAEIYDVASRLARDHNEGASVFSNAMAALEIRRRETGKKPDSRFIESMAFTADAAIDAGQLDRAADLISEAEQLARTNFGVESRAYASVLAARGRLNLIQEKYKQAVNDLESTIKIYRRRSEVDPGELPAPLVHLAQAAFFLGDVQKAYRSVTEAYEIDLSVYGPDHPETKKDEQIMLTMNMFRHT